MRTPILLMLCAACLHSGVFAASLFDETDPALAITAAAAELQAQVNGSVLTNGIEFDDACRGWGVRHPDWPLVPAVSRFLTAKKRL